MPDMNTNVDEFFERYATALLGRDAKAVAEMYAVPSLIVFPGNIIPVSDSKQTEEFFASSWGQYEGVQQVERETTIMAEAPGSVWVDVTWSYRGQPRERFCYQLVEQAHGYQIVVLTPLG
jgi:ketosteroid isomerase-like protein